MELRKYSPGKLNLVLNVLGRRPDGYHELETVLHPLGVHDVLYFETRAQGIELTCTDPRLPTDERNLVYRAARAFFEASGVRAGIRIHLEKQLPQGAGLGGGSGNAATTLLALNECYGRPLEWTLLHALGAKLGADVPFFLGDRPALATGRGDCLEWLDWFPALRGCAFVVVHPGFGIPTPWAYAQLARFPEALHGQPGRARGVIRALCGPDPRTAAAQFYNAFEAPAFEKYPVLALYRQFFEEHGALGARMTGSGSAVFAVVPEERTGLQMVEVLKGRFGARLWTAVVPVRPAGSAG